MKQVREGDAAMEEQEQVSSDEEFEELLPRLHLGDRAALDRLMDLAYRDLQRRAHHQLSNAGGKLSTTTLVHETYLRLARARSLRVNDRAHFFRMASHAMRQIVIDFARSSAAAKRGGGEGTICLEERRAGKEYAVHEMILVEESLTYLASLDERLASMVELRFFGGLSMEEIAEMSNLSVRTIKRDWRKARALIQGYLNGRLEGARP